jgi:hypothetical protein
MEAADFSGYATKAGLKCSDGRTITAEAFKHMDGETIPLVWQHGHDSPDNVLGHAVLEARDDGMYAHGYFNATKQGDNAKLLVQHKDIKNLSIYANNLVEKSKVVLHGNIREVSLVLAGANPGALIDQVRLAHSDDPNDFELLEDQAVIHTGLTLEHSVTVDDAGKRTVNDIVGEMSEEQQGAVQAILHAALEHAADDLSLDDLYNTLSEKQQQALEYMVGKAAENAGSATHSEGEVDASTFVESDGEEIVHADGETLKDIYESFNADQKLLAQFMIGQAVEAAGTGTAAHSDTQTDDTNSEGDLTHQEGTPTMTNVFEQAGKGTAPANTLSHSDIAGIMKSAQKSGSFKEALQEHALAHSITDIELLFPDAKAITDSPQYIARRSEWVASVLDGTKHAPFAKIKTILADITADEARAKGYIKGERKVEEVLTLLRRTTGPTTIYKKQALDRDDIIDITDIDVVLWLKAEMRLMIEEEVARAILVGDGRSALSPDKVKDPAGSIDGLGIRSIANDDDLYSVKYNLAANVSPKDAVKGLVRARSKYRGTGKPTLYVSDSFLTDIMLEEDKFGRALYETEQVLMDKLRVAAIVTVDLFDETQDLLAIMVSLSDYTIGANRGGELTSFEDFDIDFNKQKYLQETRLSGGLTKPFSAVVVRRASGTLATAVAPSFDGATDDILIPTVEGVFYTINDEIVTGTVHITSPTEVEANPADGFYLASNSTRSWTYAP